jgi:hypothetical protein
MPHALVSRFVPKPSQSPRPGKMDDVDGGGHTEEELTAFYQAFAPNHVCNIPGLLRSFNSHDTDSLNNYLLLKYGKCLADIPRMATHTRSTPTAASPASMHVARRDDTEGDMSEERWMQTGIPGSPSALGRPVRAQELDAMQRTVNRSQERADRCQHKFAVQESLETFYRRYAPGDIGNLPGLMRSFNVDEMQSLNEYLRIKYSKCLSDIPGGMPGQDVLQQLETASSITYPIARSPVVPGEIPSGTISKEEVRSASPVPFPGISEAGGSQKVSEELSTSTPTAHQNERETALQSLREEVQDLEEEVTPILGPELHKGPPPLPVVEILGKCSCCQHEVREDQRVSLSGGNYYHEVSSPHLLLAK